MCTYLFSFLFQSFAIALFLNLSHQQAYFKKNVGTCFYRKPNTNLFIYLFILVSLFRVGFFYRRLTLRQLIQPDFEFRFIFRSPLGPSFQSGYSPCAGLQVVTQPTHLSKDCYPQLVLNPLNPFRNLVCKVAGLQAHATKPGKLIFTDL